ncbi:MAG: hypothetical protein HYS13_22070 [Planctomycetia bacterium]|nr:hypothetical protein [Planctomycetia bacterium]
MDPFEPHEVEMAEEEIEHLPETAPPRLDKAKIIEYLKYGGLISILRSGLGGAPARAWLCPDTLGNVTHTFAAERGVVGGEPIPMAAVFESRVSKPKQEGVASYLRSFGLDQREARQVVAFIGTAP